MLVLYVNEQYFRTFLEIFQEKICIFYQHACQSGQKRIDMSAIGQSKKSSTTCFKSTAYSSCSCGI